MKRMMLMGLILGAITAAASSDESDGIFTSMIGRYEVSMIVEGEREGNTGILVGADPSIINRYIRAGFKHSTNVFLIKTPTQNILIDAGTGADPSDRGGIVIEKIKKLGVQPEQINAVLITHLHGDHFGSLQRDGKAVFPNAKIYLSQREFDFYTKTDINRNAVAALAPYTAGSNVVTFEPAVLGSRLTEILPGISPIAAYGHTPGHTIYLVQDGESGLLIIGDLLHLALVQFPVPEISATYDMNQQAAAVIRRLVLDYALRNRISVGGMHIAYPGIGTLLRDADGFTFTPVRE